MAKITVPTSVALARCGCATMSDAQRIAFAIELVRDVVDTHCSFHLVRLGQLASATAQELARARSEQECG